MQGSLQSGIASISHPMVTALGKGDARLHRSAPPVLLMMAEARLRDLRNVMKAGDLSSIPAGAVVSLVSKKAGESIVEITTRRNDLQGMPKSSMPRYPGEGLSERLQQKF